MIRIGPAGIPLSCKGRTNKDGLIYTRSLGLNTMEVQFVRGLHVMDEDDAEELGRLAKEYDVELHVHAPYYTNLAGDEANIEMSFDKIMSAAMLANLMGAKVIAVHPGYYGELSKKEAMERVVANVRELRDMFKSEGFSVKLGIETMGKQKVFGSIDEVVEVCRRVNDVVPVLDFGHIHARGNGSLKTKEDFNEIFQKVAGLGRDAYLLHVTGVLYRNGNEYHHLPIKKGDMKIEPLLEVILENNYNVSLISESPILEHDAVYTQIVMDRIMDKLHSRHRPDDEEDEEISEPREKLEYEIEGEKHQAAKKKQAKKIAAEKKVSRKRVKEETEPEKEE
ncbi:MAG: AP endonuclease [Thermoplasmata archaeon HGW-Thermoplasmata-1]|nr:MAG: AP endonuclease [Thermoplasmata archaeon HGW-Thermoplasmata-1]